MDGCEGAQGWLAEGVESVGYVLQDEVSAV